MCLGEGTNHCGKLKVRSTQKYEVNSYLRKASNFSGVMVALSSALSLPPRHSFVSAMKARPVLRLGLKDRVVR